MKDHSPIFETNYEHIKKNGQISRSRKKENMYNVNLSLEIDDNGTKTIYQIPFKSYLKNFGYLLSNILFATTNQLKGTNATLSEAGADKCLVTEPEMTTTTDSSYGIWVGDLNQLSETSTAYVSVPAVTSILNYNDYTLRNKIRANASVMKYGDTNVTMPTADTVRVSRKFTNNSTTSLYISEIGLVGKHVGSTTTYAMIARDGFNDGTNLYVKVDSGAMVTINYDFTATQNSHVTNNWVGMLSSIFNGSTSMNTLTAVDGTTSNVNVNSGFEIRNDYCCFALGGSTTTPQTQTISTLINSYKLENSFDDTQITKSAQTVINVTTGSGKTTFGVMADFENITTSNCYINEMGLTVHTPSNDFLLRRDQISDVTSPYYKILGSGDILRITAKISLPLGNIPIIKEELIIE